MCKELIHEMYTGKYLAVDLVSHLKSMGASSLSIPIEDDDYEYEINTVRKKKGQ